MEPLDYIEAQAQKSAAFSLETLELMTKRAYALLTLFLAGAGTAGTFALNQLAKSEGRFVMWALGAVSLWWFCLAAWVALRALQSREVRPPANSGADLLSYLQGPLADYCKELEAEGQAQPSGLALLREGEIKVLAQTAKQYTAASTQIATALDAAYRGAICTPLVAFVGLLPAWLL